MRMISSIILLSIIISISKCNENEELLKGGIHACLSYSNDAENFGCSSSFNGNYGDICIIETHTDIRAYDDKCVYVFYPKLFTIENIKSLEELNVDKISGIILIKPNHDKYPEHMSFDAKCPRLVPGQISNDCINNMWNPNGTNMILRSFKYPIIYISDSVNVNKILTCYTDRIKTSLYPRCGISIKSFMNSYSLSTQTCLSKNGIAYGSEDSTFCNKILAQNIYAHFPSHVDSNDFIIISTKLDTRSLFLNANPGASSELASLLVFLSSLTTIAEFIKSEQITLTTNLLFIGFDAEFYDAVGSSAFAYNLINAKLERFANLTSESIKAWIEVGSIGQMDNILFAHQFNNFSSDSTFTSSSEKIFNKLKEQLSATNIVLQKSKNKFKFPSSSLLTIFRHDLHIPGLFISDFDDEITNKYFNGLFDDYTNLGLSSKEDLATSKFVKRMTNLTIGLVKTILNFTQNSNVTNITVSEINVLELAECLLFSLKCPLFARSLHRGFCAKCENTTVFARDAAGDTEYILAISQYIGYHMGTLFPKNSPLCAFKNAKLLNFVTETMCLVNASVYTSFYASPYFTISNKYTNYSSWTVSEYKEPHIHLYYTMSPEYYMKTVYLGLFTTIVAVALSILIRMKHNLFFKQ